MVRNLHWQTRWILDGDSCWSFFCRKLMPMHSNGETWCKHTGENSNNCPKTRNYPKYVPKRVWSWWNKDNTSILLMQKKEKRCNIEAENTHSLGTKRGLISEGGFANARFGLSWTKSLQSWWPIQYCSWGSMFIWRSNRILNGVDKFVRESMLTKEWEDTVSVNIAEAEARPRRPRQKATVTLTSVSFLVHERRWIDIETQRWNDHKCFEVSKAVARLLRHDPTVPREPDGAIQSMHEMGEMKRAQELRVDEFSVQKLRESQETIQRLISQMLQEQVNSLNDLGEFQEVDSN